jgi:hypothetical protein
MMKIRILVQCVTTLQGYAPGEVVEMPDGDATSMVTARLAEPVENPVSLTPPVHEIPERRKRKTEER